MAGKTVQTNPSMISWEELPERLRESNRRQADHIGLKLKAIGCGIAPLTDWDAKLFQFKDYEIERMAWLEHLRWMEELQEQGWTFAPGNKNEERKTHPYLVPWEKLPEEVKDYDRNAVKKIPLFLSKIDLQVFRLPGKPFGLSLKVMIRDKRGRYLLLKRSKDSKTNPGKWDFPGGKADAGENIDEALVREVAEETGLTISLQKLVGTAQSEILGFRVVHLILEGRLESGEIKLSHEHDDYVWVKPGKLPNMELVDHFKPFAREYGKKKSK
jgi:8-oxo-dGTP diphosphatase